MTWLPLKGTRRHLWNTWLWGNVRWEACGAPWEKHTPVCQLCGQHHGTTAHQRLISCSKWRPSFIHLWTHSSGEWHQQAHEWLLTATADDLKQVSCLRIPNTFIDTLPSKAKKNIRYQVPWFQHMLPGVTALRSTLPMPPHVPGQPTPASTSVSPWYGKLRGRVTQPNPIEKNLSEQVRYRQGKRKQRSARTPQTKDPTKQVTELLMVPLTTAAKACILRLALRCDSGIKLQLLDRLYEADKQVPMDPPRPVLLLEHCMGLATMMRTYQLTAARLLEQRHLITR